VVLVLFVFRHFGFYDEGVFLKIIFQRIEGAKLQQKRSTVRKFQKIFAKFAASEASAQARLTDK
jgi:hypothetical protein